VNHALTLPHVRERFASYGVELSGGTPEQFTKQIRTDAAKWAGVIKRAGVKPE
jgi:tripartite-type tricarboxylate transporter receptor subunit TctC